MFTHIHPRLNHCVRADWFFRPPLTQREHPRRGEPEEEDEDEERAPGVFVQQHLEHEAEGEVDVVERTNAPVGGAEQHFAVQQDGPVHQVQAEEHQHGQEELQVHVGVASAVRNAGRRRGGVGGGGVGRVSGVQVRANGVDDADQQLQRDYQNPLAGHGNAPVHLVVVDDEQLRDERLKRRFSGWKHGDG